MGMLIDRLARKRKWNKSKIETANLIVDIIFTIGLFYLLIINRPVVCDCSKVCPMPSASVSVIPNITSINVTNITYTNATHGVPYEQNNDIGNNQSPETNEP